MSRIGQATNVDLSENIPLTNLSDVTISSPADNELLAYDSGTSEWINQTPTEAGLDTRYLQISNDLSDLNSASTARTNLGLVAGGTGDIWVEKAGDTMAGNLTFSGAQKIIGGTGTTSDLTLQTTSGVGATGADMHFLVGNNGATEAMTILNSGNVGIGTDSPGAKLELAGSADEVQFILKANATQSIGNPLIQLQSSDSTPIFEINSDGSSNVFIGVNAGDANTSGTNNIFIGNGSGGTNTGGRRNVAIGSRTLGSNSTGNENSAFGYEALLVNTGGNQAAFGASALTSNTTGAGNTAMGRIALKFNKTGDNNTALGYQAGVGVISSSDISNNVLVGFKSGLALLTGGDNNILVGYQAADALTTGDTNIVIGYDIDLPAVDSSNMLDIGNLIYATGLTSTGTTVSSGNVGIGTVSPGAKLQVNAGSASTIGQIIKAASSQTANLTEYQDSSGNALVYVDSGGRVVMNNASPRFDLYETDAAADEKIWRTSSVGGQFRITARNDADNAGDPFLTVDRTGVTVDTITYSTTDAIYEGNLKVVVGSGVDGILRIESDSPTIQQYDLNSPTDEKLWTWNIVNGQLRLVARNDADSGGSSWLRVDRTGTTIDLIDFKSYVQITGASDNVQLTVKANATQTANLQEWQDSSAAILTRVGADGVLMLVNSAGGPTLDAAGEIGVDTTSRSLNFHDGTAEVVLQPERSKSITIEDPGASEDISVFFTNRAITVSEIRAVLVGSSTPSVTWTIRHGTDRSAAGAEVVTSGTTTTSTTTGSDVTSFNDATIVADSFVWLETTAQSGTVDELHVTIVYNIDA